MGQLLRKLQLHQLSILKVIDSFCRENKICYSLYAGTLLGAVRHKGFIPWDDDLDICMERSEYGRFLRLWQESAPDGFILQNKENTPGFAQSFTKIRKEHTTYIQETWEASAYHTGIFVDIFPIDRIPDNKLKRLVFVWDCLQYQLFNREFIPPKGGAAEKTVSAVLLALVKGRNREKRRSELLNRITQYDDPNYQTIGIETVSTIRKPLPADMMESYVELPFEDAEFMWMSGWDKYLSAKFGDYMTPPPESERAWKHHPILLDFEHDYEELVALNGKVLFPDTATR